MKQNWTYCHNMTDQLSSVGEAVITLHAEV